MGMQALQVSRFSGTDAGDTTRQNLLHAGLAQLLHVAPKALRVHKPAADGAVPGIDTPELTLHRG